ncbi:hypothetical protein [Streptosporangium lutulentum]|uniref:Uncharacterized protein n=1 Tax=Streptosporangium lutulentum TaxID=1461250 RepID=A0ABT9QLS6_9ACTN|nr:hypothetical protein [Streptosporangium lutulentum]MDP9847711.1 hypothetical protein [Streptosporangium lutulentum]
MRRYRLGRLAAVVNMTAVVVAVVVSLVRDSLDPAWTVVQWYPPSRSADETSLLAVLGGLLLVGAVNSWMFWQVLQGPADAAPLPRRALWLRRLLYVYVGWLLIPVPLPDEVRTAFDVVLWVPIVILFAQVLTHSGPAFRLILVTTALLSTMLSWVLVAVPRDGYADRGAPVLSTVILALVAVGLAWLLMTLIAQRRDGRWRRTTMVLGACQLAVIPVAVVLNQLVDFPESVVLFDLVYVLAVFQPVWLARTAHELNRPGTAPDPGPLRSPRWLLAPMVLAPMAVIAPEAKPHMTYSWLDADCSSIPLFADTPPQDRRRVYLCLAGDGRLYENIRFWSRGGSPVTDQQLLGRGWKSCAAGDGKVRAEALVYLCPEVVARDQPDLLLTAAQLKQRDAKERARRRQAVVDEAAQYVSGCRDPWPALRTSRQATAVHLPTDWDGYHIFNGRQASLDALYDENLESDSPLVAHGGAAMVSTTLEYGATCVTVKVLRTAPPIRRKGWDDVVDADLVLGSGRVHLKGRGIEVAVALPKAGKYRVRLHTRTLDEGIGEDLVVVFPTSQRRP